MRLKKASAWYYNKGKTHVNIDELGLMLHEGEVVDLFQLNPNLSWDQYHRSATTGVLAQKKNLVALPGPPVRNKPIQKPVWPSKPMASRSKSSLVMGKDTEDYLATIESEFGEGSGKLAQEQMWKIERDKYLEVLASSEQGEDGEVFSDKMFDEEYLSDLTD